MLGRKSFPIFSDTQNRRVEIGSVETITASTFTVNFTTPFINTPTVFLTIDDVGGSFAPRAVTLDVNTSNFKIRINGTPSTSCSTRWIAIGV